MNSWNFWLILILVFCVLYGPLFGFRTKRPPTRRQEEAKDLHRSEEDE